MISREPLNIENPVFAETEEAQTSLVSGMCLTELEGRAL